MHLLELLGPSRVYPRNSPQASEARAREPLLRGVGPTSVAIEVTPPQAMPTDLVDSESKFVGLVMQLLASDSASQRAGRISPRMLPGQDDLEDLLFSRSADVWLFRDGEGISIERQDVGRGLMAGGTVQVESSEFLSRPIGNLCGLVRCGIGGSPARANLYAQLAGAPGSREHYDSSHVLILQVSGQKLWRVSTSGRDAAELPTWLERTGQEDFELGHPRAEAEVLLEPGDLLWIRRGDLHFAKPVGTGLVTQLSFMLFVPTIGDYLHWLLQLAATDTAGGSARVTLPVWEPAEAASLAARAALELADQAGSTDRLAEFLAYMVTEHPSGGAVGPWRLARPLQVDDEVARSSVPARVAQGSVWFPAGCARVPPEHVRAVSMILALPYSEPVVFADLLRDCTAYCTPEVGQQLVEDLVVLGLFEVLCEEV